MAATDEEGNIISPLGCFKLVPRPVSTSAAVSRPVSTCSVVPGSSPSSPATSRMVTTTVTTNSISRPGCMSFPAFSKPALGTAAVTTTTRCATLLLPPVISPAMTAAFTPASVFRSSGQSPAVTFTPCIKGRFTTPPKLASKQAIAIKDKANSEMIKKLMATLEDRDITIGKLRLETEVKSLDSQPPKLANIEQTLRYESALQDMKTALDDKDITIDRLKSEIDSMSSDLTQRLEKVSTISNSWVNLVMQLRSQSLAKQRKEIKKLEHRVADLVHEDGLMTDMGIIGMPQEPVHGYSWDDDTGGWVIATGCC